MFCAVVGATQDTLLNVEPTTLLWLRSATSFHYHHGDSIDLTWLDQAVIGCRKLILPSSAAIATVPLAYRRRMIRMSPMFENEGIDPKPTQTTPINRALNAVTPT